MNLDPYDELKSSFLAVIGAGFFMLCFLFFAMKIKEHFNRPKCSDSELHQVIEKVEACTKSKVICSSEDKDKILHEVCR